LNHEMAVRFRDRRSFVLCHALDGGLPFSALSSGERHRPK
jgi:hypothetical protein